MNDRELLEWAAKASGIELVQYEIKEDAPFFDSATLHPWNPLTDDGDALRLAVKLNISLHYMNGRVVSHHKNIECIESSRENGEENTRRAIVRAAADIGRAMP